MAAKFEIEAEFNRVYEENLRNGWTKNTAEIRPCGDGFELVELLAGVSGKPAWKRVMFNRCHEECVAAASRRGLMLQ